VINSLAGPKRPGGPTIVSLCLVSTEASHAELALSLVMEALGETLVTLNDLMCGV
jgi:heterodisulfide reductase subunit B